MSSDWGAGNWSSVYNLSTHNPANVRYVNGIAVLAMTADNATGYSGTPPVDTMAVVSGTGGASVTGSGGAVAIGGASGTAGMPSIGDAGGGCACVVAGGGTTGGMGAIALLLIAACVRFRRSRR